MDKLNSVDPVAGERRVDRRKSDRRKTPLNSVVWQSMIPSMAQYHWLPVDKAHSRFLKPAIEHLDDGDIFLYCRVDEHKTSRLNADGIWLLRGRFCGSDVAIAWCDFRVKGASFGSASSRRLTAFLASIDAIGLPLVFVLNSLGLRFMEGRTIFSDVFSLVPALNQFRKNNLLITLCRGRCLGMGALLYSLGHYRMATDPSATLSLTGPEVFELFFGERIAFDEVAGVNAQYLKTGLIHSISDNTSEAMKSSLNLLIQLGCQQPFDPLCLPEPCDDFSFVARNRYKASLAAISCLKLISGNGIELFGGYDERLKVYILDFEGKRLAVLINPPDQANNMFCYRSLELYEHAIKLFSVLKLPLLVLLDTPGIDPRFDGQNQGTIEKLISVTELILNYPMPSIGVINGRSYGGANSLAIPKCYGAVANYGLKGRMQIDVMHESIMRSLLSGSKELLESWEIMHKQQCDNCEDLIAQGLIDEAITLEQLPDKIRQDLF